MDVEFAFQDVAEAPHANDERHSGLAAQSDGAADFAISISRVCQAIVAGSGLPDSVKFVSIEGKPIQIQPDQCRSATVIVAELIDNACRPCGSLEAGPIVVTAGHRGGWIFCSVSTDRSTDRNPSLRGKGLADALAARIKGIVARRVTPSQITVTLLFDAFAPAPIPGNVM
jgi:two-component sensor histidine kinase